MYIHMVDMQAGAATPHYQADLPPFHHVRHRTWQRWTTLGSGLGGRGRFRSWGVYAGLVDRAAVAAGGARGSCSRSVRALQVSAPVR